MSDSLIIKGRFAVLNDPPFSGGMADVYKAVDLQNSGSLVAVKVFKHGSIDEPVIAESFRREVQALKELKHPNIIELIDEGFDSETGHNYLVFPWVDSKLEQFLQEQELLGWDDYWQIIGRPILEALAFSHERQYIHRDLKPSNILIDKKQKVLLGDFGISKIKSYFRPSITLAEFTSRPFTPPEYDDGSYTYTRDVYGFGAVTLQCLIDYELRDYSDLEESLGKVDLPPKIKEIIELCISREPSERPANAEYLLGKLLEIQEAREKRFAEKSEVCYVSLHPKTLARLKEELHLPEGQIHSRIEEDLNFACGIKTYKNFQRDDGKQNAENHFRIFSDSFSFHAAADESVLTILNVRFLTPSLLEREREEAFEPNLNFKVGKPIHLSTAKQLVRQLVLSVAEFEEDLKLHKEEAEKERVFEVWRNILRAKLDWEREKQPPLKYSDVEISGNRLIFDLVQVPDNDITGQPWHITTGKERKISVLRGDVEDVQDEKLTLYVQYGKVDSIPTEGDLSFDIRAAESALSRQRSALDAIRYDRSLRADLRQILINPNQAKCPRKDAPESYFQEMNLSQKEAVDAAVNTEDFLVVEGPPGTGKTRFITEVILHELAKNPNTSILLSSQTHVALDNALERLSSAAPDLSLVRLGNHEKVAENIHGLLIENQMERWLDQAQAKSQNFMEKWATQLGIDIQKLQESALLRKLGKALDADFALKQEIFETNESRKKLIPFPVKDNKKIDLYDYGISEEVIREIEEVEDQIDLLEAKRRKNKEFREKVSRDLEIFTGRNYKKFMKLSADQINAKLSDLVNTENDQIKRLQQLLELQAEWFTQFGRSEEFQPALLKRVQVIAGTCVGSAKNISTLDFDLCIIDEASKATATEVLVPLSRAKRWILVGDSKQLPPFQDEVVQDQRFLEKYNLNCDEVQKTLFDMLRESLPKECTKRLSIQHRMVQPIGDLVSKCFYDDLIESKGPDIDSALAKILPKPVTWFTTSRISSCHERFQNLSFSNPQEANFIIHFLKGLNILAQEIGIRYQVAILTGYTAQKNLINRSIDGESSELNFLSLECNTVDAFQGREADLAIFSVTRSNKKGNLGFLQKRERLNVALSRGRLGLVIVGDHFFCRTAAYNPLQDVISHIESHNDDCKLQEIQL
jgi:serine/threonine protein kinase